jgi:hypothetical protein
LYPSTDTYTQQLRALEAHCRQTPNDAAAAFVLAYHYLVTGHNDNAGRALKFVTQRQPGDQVAKRLLDSLTPELAAQPAAVATTAAPTAAPAAQAAAPPSTPEPTTDLVGRWRAERNGSAFELTIGEQSEFTWKATPAGKPAITLTGQVVVTNDTLALESKEKGTMVGQVTSGGPDRFQFATPGGPPGDKGLTFQRL